MKTKGITMTGHASPASRDTAALIVAMVMSLTALGVAWSGSDQIALGAIVLPVPVWADCKQMARGAYDVRRANDPTQADEEERGQYWVEFVQGNVVRGREVATVVTPEQADRMNKGVARPDANGARIDLVQASHYVRVWISHGRFDYLIHLPIAPETCVQPPLVALSR